MSHEFGKDANVWWVKMFPDSEMVPLDDLVKQMMNDKKTFGDSEDVNKLDVQSIVRDVMGAEFRNKAPAPPSLNSTMSQSSSLYVMYDPEGEEDSSSGYLVKRADFKNFCMRLGPLNGILKRSIRNFIVNGSIVPWFHGKISRKDAENYIKRMWKKIRSSGIFLLRTSNHIRSQFVISVIVKKTQDEKTGGKKTKWLFRHEVLHNSGKLGFSKMPMNQPDNDTYDTITQYLETDRAKYTIPTTRDVYSYWDVNEKRVEINREQKNILIQQSLVVEDCLNLVTLVNKTE